MLEQKQYELYNEFYASTHNNDHIDTRTELLVGFAASVAFNCDPCTYYYLDKAKRAGIKKQELGEVLAKVMAVAAGQKRLQTNYVMEKYGVAFEAK